MAAALDVMGPLAKFVYAMESEGRSSIVHALKGLLFVCNDVFKNPGLQSHAFSGRPASRYEHCKPEFTGW